VERLAEVARFPAWLTMLYVLTCTDIRAVGPGVWNAWRGALLRTLYLRTRTRLAGRFPKPPRRAVVAQRIVQALADPAYAEAAERHLQAMSDRYVRTTSPQRMAAHLRLIDRLREEAAVTEVFHFPDLGASDFVVVTRDTPGLFALIAGTLAAHGVNILSAQIETRADDVAVDTFHVNDPTGDAIVDESRWEAVTRDLRRALAGECSVETLLGARARRPGLARPAASGRARVTVDNSLSDTHTVVEVKAPDRVGLLHVVTRALAAEGLDIATAKIATDLDHALDTFYVTDRTGRRIEEPGALARLRAALEGALAEEAFPSARTV
jgi:[protein-PII] uridylyltransferase